MNGGCNKSEVIEKSKITRKHIYYNMKHGNTLDEAVLKGLLRKYKNCKI